MRNRRRIKDALHADFVWHPEAIADLIEILGVVSRAEYVLAELPRWMADEVRPIDPQMWGSAEAMVRYQPKGVIGNMVPWNFPFDIAFGPLIEMLAAGNRVILKPSDLGPASAAAIADIVAEAFDETQVAVVTGGMEMAEAFSALPWDHLMFTGSPAVGRKVMAAAAKNLTAVTLELGGKCPAILSRDAVDAQTVGNIIGMKLLKSGQVCVAPDHVFVPRDRVEDFVTLVHQHVESGLSQHTADRDATGIITPRHFDRLTELVEKARAAGSVVVQPEVGAIGDRGRRQFPLTLIVDPDPDLGVMTEEIFGPILPIVPYDTVESVIDKVNAGERPLALYVYAQDRVFSNAVLARTTSGGACVNLSLLHGAIAPLPFGGIGNSGMGRHHGIEGFREFSNPRGVFVRGEGGAIDAFNPPYRTLEAIVDGAFRQRRRSVTKSYQESRMTAFDTAPAGRMARRRQVTRDSLMAAGQQLFAVRPIDSVSIDEIVDIADVAKGSFYNHFSDKDALAKAIVEMVGGDCEFHIKAANCGIDDPALRVARAIGVMIRYALTYPERVQSVINLSERKTDAASPLNRGLRFDLVDGLSTGRFQDVDLETGALLVLGMITVTLRHRVESGTTTTAPDAAARVAAVVLRGLGLSPDEARSLGEGAAALIEAEAR